MTDNNENQASFAKGIALWKRTFEPMEPVPTGETALLTPVTGIKAVIFDIYGTLFQSGVGDISLAEKQSGGDRNHKLYQCLLEEGLKPESDYEHWVSDLHNAITAESKQWKLKGKDYPEIDIRDIWKHCLCDWNKAGRVSLPDGHSFAVECLSMRYEAAVNPCWPMPHLRETLNGLRSKGLMLGIISNAQFFTPCLFDALLELSPDDLGFAPEGRFYSYRYHVAKPSTALYEQCANWLSKEHGITPGQTLYIGNDQRNDIMPAAQVGFRTVLFAGDKRSLRKRMEDAQASAHPSDMVITGLDQLLSVLSK